MNLLLFVFFFFSLLASEIYERVSGEQCRLVVKRTIGVAVILLVFHADKEKRKKEK